MKTQTNTFFFRVPVDIVHLNHPLPWIRIYLILFWQPNLTQSSKGSCWLACISNLLAVLLSWNWPSHEAPGWPHKHESWSSAEHLDNALGGIEGQRREDQDPQWFQGTTSRWCSCYWVIPSSKRLIENFRGSTPKCEAPCLGCWTGVPLVYIIWWSGVSVEI